MICEIPISWVTLQGLDAPIECFGAVELYRAFCAGTDPMATQYGRERRHPDLAARIEELRLACLGPMPTDPLPVMLTATGRYELIDGHHRAARALVDGRETITVDVRYVSVLWARLVSELESIYPNRPHHLYQPIEHPYFTGWTTDREPRRLDVVFDALRDAGVGPAEGPWMEIGSCTGRFCREAARRGWIAFGLEIDPAMRGVAEHLGLVFRRHVTYYDVADPVEWLASVQAQMGVILCLSVFHRYIHAGRHEWVAEVYRQCAAQSRAFILDCGSPQEAALQPSPVPLDRDGFRAWFSALAPGKRVTPIGETEGRVIYLVR